jgi:hypothetical protein
MASISTVSREGPTLVYELDLSVWDGLFLPSGDRRNLKKCGVCGLIDELPPPRTFEAENPIRSDFAAGMAFSLCKESVFREWNHDFPEVLSHPILLENRRWKSYDADPYVQLYFDVTINPDPTLPRFSSAESCQGCGRITIGAHQRDRLDVKYFDGNVKDAWNAIARKDALQGRDFAFFLESIMICTEKGKQYVESKGWSNIKPVPYGTLV